MFTHPEDEEAAHDLMGKLMPELLKIGLISDVLAQSDGGGAQHESGADGTWSRTCMCIVRLPEQYAPPELPRPLRHRRMDLKARLAFLLRVRHLLTAHPPGLPRVAHAVRAAVLHWQRPLQPLHALLGQAGVLNECLFCCLLRVPDSRCLCLSQLHYSLSDKGLVKCMDKKSGSRKTAVRVLGLCGRSAHRPLTPRMLRSTTRLCRRATSATSSRRCSWSTWSRTDAACDSRRRCSACHRRRDSPDVRQNLPSAYRGCLAYVAPAQR